MKNNKYQVDQHNLFFIQSKTILDLDLSKSKHTSL